MKIEAGKFYKTRGGEKAYVVGIVPDEVDCFESNRVIGVLEKEPESWFLDGRYLDVTEQEADLIAPWPEEATGDPNKPWTLEQYRPLQGDELKALVGKVLVAKKTGNHVLVTHSDGETTYIEGIPHCNEMLIFRYTHLDGSPIGKLL